MTQQATPTLPGLLDDIRQRITDTLAYMAHQVPPIDARDVGIRNDHSRRLHLGTAYLSECNDYDALVAYYDHLKGRLREYEQGSNLT